MASRMDSLKSGEDHKAFFQTVSEKGKLTLRDFKVSRGIQKGVKHLAFAVLFNVDITD